MGWRGGGVVEGKRKEWTEGEERRGCEGWRRKEEVVFVDVERCGKSVGLTF